MYENKFPEVDDVVMVEVWRCFVAQCASPFLESHPKAT
jgi:hypothetical protein